MKKLLLIISLSLLAHGCVIVAGDTDPDDFNYSETSSWRAAQDENRSKIATLELGSSRLAVMDMLGKPDFSEAFSANGSDNIQVLFYRTHRTHEDGKTTKDETTPLVFKNDKLIGWGADALHKVR